MTSTNNMEQQLLDAYDVMNILKVSRTTLWRYTQRGQLHPLRFGPFCKVFYLHSEIKEILANKAINQQQL